MSMESSGQHLCILIHSHRPYCFDLNEILALPSGFRYRNRFDNQWIVPALRQDIEKVSGDEVLLVLRDRELNRLIPVRWGSLFNVQRIGKVTLFEYHLADLVEYSNDENVRIHEIIAHTKLFSDTHTWLPGTAGQQLSTPSVFNSKVGYGLTRADANDLTAWGNCVAALATAPSYERIEFLKIVGLLSAKGERAPVDKESFVVKANSVYQLKVFQSVPDPGTDEIPSHSLTLNSFNGHITALRPTLQAVGKYDMLTFVIKVLDLAPGEQTALEIPHQPDAATVKSASTSLYLPLRVREAGIGRLVAAALLAVVSLFFMFRPMIGTLSSVTIKNVATIVFILTVAGPSQMLSSLWPSWPWRSGK